MSQSVRALNRPRALRRAPRAFWPAFSFLLLSAAAAHAQQTAPPFRGSLLRPAAAGRAPVARGGSAPQEEEEVVKPSRPGVAMPAEIPEPGVFQIEFGYDGNFRARETRAEHTLPLTLRFSAARRLLLEADVETFKSETDGQTRERRSGVGDTRLGLQVVALEDRPGRPALAFAYFVKIPSASEEKQLGTGRFDHKFVGLLSKKFGRTDLDFNVAYLLVGEEGGGREHGGQGALSVSREFENDFGFAAELAGQSHDDVQPRGLFALGALTYKAGPRLVLDAGLRFGLNPEAPRVGVFAGLTVGVGRL
ncbi:MAG: transporter [Acidobacteriota bacterium]|nr:transporter [Acidobacteriota bacterium]